jgi:hypothetical protein
MTAYNRLMTARKRTPGIVADPPVSAATDRERQELQEIRRTVKSIDQLAKEQGHGPMTPERWEAMRAKFVKVFPTQKDVDDFNEWLREERAERRRHAKG